MLTLIESDKLISLSYIYDRLHNIDKINNIELRRILDKIIVEYNQCKKTNIKTFIQYSDSSYIIKLHMLKELKDFPVKLSRTWETGAEVIENHHVNSLELIIQWTYDIYNFNYKVPSAFVIGEDNLIGVWKEQVSLLQATDIKEMFLGKYYMDKLDLTGFYL